MAAGPIKAADRLARWRWPAIAGLMAAVMIGGMVPPIGVALACLLFPHRSHQGGASHRAAKPAGWGHPFVTEGALPYAGV